MLVHTKRIEAYKCVVAGKFCKISAHFDATLMLGSFCCCFATHTFKPGKFHAICCGDKFSPQQNFFLAKSGLSHDENCCCDMCLQHNMSTSISVRVVLDLSVVSIARLSSFYLFDCFLYPLQDLCCHYLAPQSSMLS